jgi:hypothetical protein
MVSIMIRKREKAKIAILKELANQDFSWLELMAIIPKKYYTKGFSVNAFLEELENMRLIEKNEKKHRLVDSENMSEALRAHQADIDRILSMVYGNGDFAGQLINQEKYVLGKMLLSGLEKHLSDTRDTAKKFLDDFFRDYVEAS